MKVLVAPDSMKGALSAVSAAKIIKESILEVCPFADVEVCPLSDGGDGLIAILLHANIGVEVLVDVEDPLGRPIKASIIQLEKDVFVIEMAQAAGLDLLSFTERNPIHTSTRGVGQMILKAIQSGAKKIYLGLGGSATQDLGCGMAQALGVLFYDKKGNEINPNGGNLKNIVDIDFSHFRDLQNVSFIGVTDVKTVLLGEKGAASSFAVQKGASATSVTLLEEGAKNIAHILKIKYEEYFSRIEGTGAAGGLGFGLVTFLGGNLLMGLEVVGELLSLDEKLIASDIVVSLEGKTDEQTLQGKLPYSLALKAKLYNKMIIHFTGSWESEFDQSFEKVFDVVVPIQDKPMTLIESIDNVSSLLRHAVIRSFKLLSLGSKIK